MAACAAGVLWGTGALVVNLLVTQYGFRPEAISFWRFLLGALVLLAFFGRHIHWHRLRPVLGSVVLAGVAMAAYVLFWFLGIEQIGASIPTLIALCLPPVIVSVWTVARGQERADWQLLLVLAAALLGTVLLVTRHEPSSAQTATGSLKLGLMYSLASAFLYAGFSIISGRISIALGAGPATTCLTAVAAAAMGLFALYRPFIWPQELPPQAWFLYLGVVTAALALLAFSWGAARLKPSALTIATLLEPLTAVLLSALFLNQPMNAIQYLGGALLLISIAVLGRRSRPEPATI